MIAEMNLRELQEHCYRLADEKGFHEEGDAAHAEGSNMQHYYVMRLALIMTEVAEAIEEVRSGREVTETYYNNSDPDVPAKPEGVPSELADIVIRVLDFAGEVGIDLAAMVEEKLNYNATRGHLHGREF